MAGLLGAGWTIGKNLVTKGLPADFLIRIGEDIAKNADKKGIINRIKRAAVKVGLDVTDVAKAVGIDNLANWLAGEKVMETEYEGFLKKKNTGGMAYARKKNMGLQMNSGGSVKSKKSKKKSRGTGAAKRGTKFKGTF